MDSTCVGCEAYGLSPILRRAAEGGRLRGRTSVFIGTGIPMLAAALAKRLYAPELLPVFEFGGIGSTLDRLPLRQLGLRAKPALWQEHCTVRPGPCRTSGSPLFSAFPPTPATR